MSFSKVSEGRCDSILAKGQGSLKPFYPTRVPERNAQMQCKIDAMKYNTNTERVEKVEEKKKRKKRMTRRWVGDKKKTIQIKRNRTHSKTR
jgi:hypothetical protein